jgi:predicted permease
VAAVVGSGLAWLGSGWFDRASEGTDPPFFLVFKLDVPILLFILGVSVLAAVVAGGIPALKSSGLDVGSVLKDESRGSSSLRIGRLTKILVVGEIAMSMALLVAAGLMTKSITTLRDYDFGFDGDAVFTARVGLFESEFPDAASRALFYEDLRRRVADAPGIQASSLATILPGVGSNFSTFGVEGEAYVDDRDYPGARWGQVDPGYFRTLGVDVSMGRDFEPSDAIDAEPVAIVNASFAQRFLGEGSPLGRRFRPGRAEDDGPWLTVVGVVPDLWMQGAGNLDGDPEGYYVPVAQSDARFMSILARGPADPMDLTAAVRDAVGAANADTPIYFVETLAGRIAENTWVYNVFGVLFMIFGAVALALASIGLYGVMAFSVGRRTPEVGIRMALGAQRSQVRSLILKQGVIQTLLGVGLGFGLAVLVARTLGMVLFEVSPNDPAVFGIVALMLVGTGIAASMIPARRATRVDPLVALRSE